MSNHEAVRMHQSTHSESPQLTSRRGFLLAGSVVVAGAALLRGDLLAGNAGLTAMAASTGPRLAVGYIEGSAGAASVAAALAAGFNRVIPAASLPSGGLVDEAVAITIHGFTPNGAAGAPDTVLVDAHIASQDSHGAEPTIPFYAWTHRRASSMTSGRSRFVVSPNRSLRVGLSLAAATAATATTVFTSGRSSVLPKLQRGIYLVGFDPSAWRSGHVLPAVDDPAWESLRSMVVSVDRA